MRQAAGIALRVALALAYPLLAHAASARADGHLAALALLAVVAFVLIGQLLQLRALAWLALLLSVALVPVLATSRWAMTPVLLMPVLFLAGASWVFARTLARQREPLISRVILAVDTQGQGQLSPELQAYGLGLTRTWAWLLGLLAVFNLVLALIAVPAGVLASAGIAAPITITEVQWAWLANWVNYGLVGLLMVGEFQYRKRRFPGRYRNVMEFVGKLRDVPMAQWRQILR